MAKLLTEEEYNALVADLDRERLEWCIEHGAEWVAERNELWYDWLDAIPKTAQGATISEAIDKARGVA